MNDLYFRQIPLGAMANFVYLIGSERTRECVVVDPAWDTDALLAQVARDDMKLTGALVTHYHPDHVGGGYHGFNVEGGVAELLERVPLRIHANKHEVEGLKIVTGISDTDVVAHESGDHVTLGEVEIQLIHTPGHTPGSQCFLVRDRLVSGDTLFVDACGRVDLPGADPAAMWESLHNKLAKLPDDVVLYPGHDYGPRPTDTIARQKQSNRYLKIPTLDLWLSMMG
jgi:glyoxylase-like metal-dependent hydrolase (beta-lactamase superfamily II)